MRAFRTVLLLLGCALAIGVATAQDPAGSHRPPPPPPGAPPPPGSPPPPPPGSPPPPRYDDVRQTPPPPIESTAAPVAMDAPPQPSPPALPPETESAPMSEALLAARQSGDARALGLELIRTAQTSLDQSQPRPALAPLQEAIEVANESGDDRLGREAASLLAQAHESLGDTTAAASWRALADSYRQRIAQANDERTGTDATVGGGAQAGESPAASPPAIESAPGAGSSTARYVGWLVVLCAMLLLAWWNSRRRAAVLSEEAQALTRQQRQLRSAHHQLKQQSEALRQMAIQDALTGTMNRQSFATALQSLLQHAQAQDRSVALFVFDLDHFKDINDRHGHLAGDSALKTLVGIVRENLDSADLFGRFGGDEFLIAHVAEETAHSLGLAERIRAAVVSRSTAAGPSLPPLSVSIGIAHASARSGYGLEDLFHRADTALYAAKRAGRNRAMLEDQTHPAPPEHQPTLRNLN